MEYIKNKKVVYFADSMFSGENQSLEEEWASLIEKKLAKGGLKFENVKFTEQPPFGQMSYNILFFDWGGMSIGNSLMESFCRQILREAPDNPSKMYVMSSAMISYAMEDALDTLGDKLPNVFLSIEDFIQHYKSVEIE